MNSTITVVVNVLSVKLHKKMTLTDYLDGKGLLGRTIAVAVNGQVLRKAEYESVKLNEGDHLEIVRPVGGGQSVDTNLCVCHL